MVIEFYLKDYDGGDGDGDGGSGDEVVVEELKNFSEVVLMQAYMKQEVGATPWEGKENQKTW